MLASPFLHRAKVWYWSCVWALKCKKSESFALATFLEQVPYLSCQLFCHCKLSSTSFLTVWLLVSSKTVLGFSHKPSAVRPCHMAAPLGSRMSSSHTSLQGQSDSQKAPTSLVFKDLLLTLSFPSARSAIPVVSLWDVQIYIPYLLWCLRIHQEAWSQTSPHFLAHFHKSCELLRLDQKTQKLLIGQTQY